MDNVLVTGSNGFIGRHLVKSLISNSINVICFDSDVREKKNFDRFKDTKIGTIFHLAGISRYASSNEEHFRMSSTNVDGTQNSLDFARSKKCRIVLFSSYLYGVPIYNPVDENHPLSPHNDYAMSKKHMEDIACRYKKDFGVEVIILRLFNIYGPGQKSGYLIPDTIDRITKNTRVRIKNEDSCRDFLFIDDLVSLLMIIVRSTKKDEFIFNVGAGKSYSVDMVTKTISTHLSKTPQYEYINGKDLIKGTVANINRVKNVYGWTPNWKIEEGIKSVLKYEGLVT